MKKIIIICAIVSGSLILLLLGAYLALGCYYSPYFTYGTWINGKYCTGMDIDAVNQALIEETPEYCLTIEENGSLECITAEQIGYQVDYRAALIRVKNKQTPLNWGYYFFYPVQTELKPEIRYDDKMLLSVLENLECFQLEALNQERPLRIVKCGKAYTLKDERIKTIDKEKTITLIRNAIMRGETKLSLMDEACYLEPAMSVLDQKTYAVWNQIEKLQKFCVTYRDAALELKANGADAAGWIRKNQNGDFLLQDGKLTIDEDKIRSFTDEIASVFNSKGNVRTWKRRDGKVITIHSKGKRYEVDQEAEANDLMQMLFTGYTYERKPIYSMTGDPREEIDMGKTYIEVDMTAQKLYYYKNDECVFESDTVTGNMARGHDTPEAVCDIYYMQKNRTLHGENYESFVYYWIAVKGHIGIHDATWRDEFGGDIYKRAGSHGCINIPKEKAATLYDMVKVGIPVILYYSDH